MIPIYSRRVDRLPPPFIGGWRRRRYQGSQIPPGLSKLINSQRVRKATSKRRNSELGTRNLELVLKKDNNTNLAAADQILPVNNLAHALFKQIIVRLNGTLISPQTDTYHHKAFIEQILNNDRADGENLLPCQGWFNSLNVPDTADTALTANQLDPTHDDYAALPEDTKIAIQNRIQYLGGKRVTLRFKPFLEVFHLSKLLIPGIQIQMQLYFNNPSMWSVVYGGARTLRLTEADVNVRLFLAQVRVTPSIYRELMEKMKTGIVNYPTVRSEIRTYSHADPERYFECNNPFRNQLPNRVIVALLRQMPSTEMQQGTRSPTKSSISPASNNW